MKIVVVGNGKVGTTLTVQLAREGHDIIIVDNDERVIENVVNAYDVMGICGNGGSYDVLQQAGVATAEDVYKRQLLRYIDETQKRVLTHINHVSYYKNDEYMILDLSTRRNLELTETIRSGEKKGSLLWVLDKTVTAMGGRMLRRWLEAPLLEKKAIETRQDMVEELYRHPGALKDLKGVLGKVYDLERICGKISFGTCNLSLIHI